MNRIISTLKHQTSLIREQIVTRKRMRESITLQVSNENTSGQIPTQHSGAENNSRKKKSGKQKLY